MPTLCRKFPMTMIVRLGGDIAYERLSANDLGVVDINGVYSGAVGTLLNSSDIPVSIGSSRSSSGRATNLEPQATTGLIRTSTAGVGLLFDWDLTTR